MLDSARFRELRNGKRYNTHIEHEMSGNVSIEENVTGNSSSSFEGEVSEIHNFTQEAVIEQYTRYIAPLTLQLEELTPSVHGMVVTTAIPSYYPKADFGTTSGTATHQSDTERN